VGPYQQLLWPHLVVIQWSLGIPFVSTYVGSCEFLGPLLRTVTQGPPVSNLGGPLHTDVSELMDLPGLLMSNFFTPSQRVVHPITPFCVSFPFPESSSPNNSFFALIKESSISPTTKNRRESRHLLPTPPNTKIPSLIVLP
jgi:hypothetical protein